MPKKNPNDRKETYLIIVPLAGMVLAIFIAVIVAIPKYQQKQQENYFKKLDSTVSNLRDELNRELSGVQVVKENYCFLQQYKWEEGTIKCVIALHIGGIDMEEFFKIKKTILNSAEWVEQRAPDVENFPYRDGLYEDRETGQDCSLGVSKSGEVLSINFSCSEKSKKAFYPYKD